MEVTLNTGTYNFYINTNGIFSDCDRTTRMMSGLDFTSKFPPWIS